jgi:hypothetical protein
MVAAALSSRQLSHTYVRLSLLSSSRTQECVAACAAFVEHQLLSQPRLLAARKHGMLGSGAASLYNAC